MALVIESVDSRERFKVRRPLKLEAVIGDRLLIEDGKVLSIFPRRNYLARKEQFEKVRVLASNIDQLLIVGSFGSNFNPFITELFIISAISSNISPVLVFNKVDLKQSDESEIIKRRWKKIDVFKTSATEKIGIDALKSALTAKVSIMVGESGVGKTSLLNSIVETKEFKTKAVNPKTGKGRHTTTSSIMIRVANDAILIDSPGIREFLPSDIKPSELAFNFVEFKDHLRGCRYRDCLHQDEPGCLIKEEVANGVIASESYQDYLKILELVKLADKKKWEKLKRF